MTNVTNYSTNQGSQIVLDCSLKNSIESVLSL